MLNQLSSSDILFVCYIFNIGICLNLKIHVLAYFISVVTIDKLFDEINYRYTLSC